MIAIICKKDGDPTKSIPIMDSENDCMAIWDTEEEAREFADNHILCQISEVYFIDLEGAEIIL